MTEAEKQAHLVDKGGESSTGQGAKTVNAKESAAPPSSSKTNKKDTPPSPSSPRRVSFHESTKYHDGINGDPLGVSVPRRVKLGKGGNTAVRDAFFLFSFIGMLLYFAMTADSGDKERKREKIPLADELNKMQKTMTKMLMESVEKSRRKEGCDLFTAKGSIPDSDLGVFAGRRFLKGEVIYETSSTTPVEMSNGSIEELSSLAFLLKFHPVISNVENVNGLGSSMQLRTTRAIKPGEELFLPYEQHPLHVLSLQGRTLFEKIPLAADYDVAELLQHDIVVNARRMEVAHQRRVQDAISLNVGYLYSLGVKITNRFSPNVAKLLPDTQVKVKAREKFPLPLGALENQTLSTLQLRGSCYGDAKLSKLEDMTLFVAATRDVSKGETLQEVPVHLFKSAKPSFDRCISSNVFHACPLTDAAMIPVGAGEEANVAFEWTDDNTMKNFLKSDGSEAAAGSASLNLVAQKRIQSGQKVSADLPEKPATALPRVSCAGVSMSTAGSCTTYHF